MSDTYKISEFLRLTNVTASFNSTKSITPYNTRHYQKTHSDYFYIHLAPTDCSPKSEQVNKCKVFLIRKSHTKFSITLFTHDFHLAKTKEN